MAPMTRFIPCWPRRRRSLSVLLIMAVFTFVFYGLISDRSTVTRKSQYSPDAGKESVEKPDSDNKVFPIPADDVDDHQIESPESKPTPITIEEIQGGEPSDPEIRQLRDEVKSMMAHAWNGYEQYAWGYNEVKPISKAPHSPSVLGTAPLGASIIDALDTLIIMGLKDQLTKATEFIRTLDFNVDSSVSIFEYNIRFIGGLLSAYSMTQEKIYLTKAEELAKRLLPAFNSPTGIPKSLINLRTGTTKNFFWATAQCSILAEIGSLHMEFSYLSELTGDPIYASKVKHIRNILLERRGSSDLFYNFINPNTLNWCSYAAGLSALGDSFYEYLLKEWIRTDHADEQARQTYDSSMKAFLDRGLFKTSASHLYVGAITGTSVSSSMDHLACFTGGMLALGAKGKDDPWFKRGQDITETCRRSYMVTETGLGPEKFSFGNGVEAVAIGSGPKSYLLRPETVESYFYLWRFTKDKKYRDWARDVVKALQTYCKVEGGYTGLLDVYSSNPRKDNVQQTYFLAETLKYLYLIFSEDSLLPLDRWVFNTEAHPLPIQNKVSIPNVRWPAL